MSAEIVQLAKEAAPYLSPAVGAYTAGALRQRIKRTLREDAELAREMARLLPAAGGVTVNVSGTRAIGAQHIGIAATGNNSPIHPLQQ